MTAVTSQAGDAASKMDAIYRAQRHIYDLTRKYYLLGRDQMLDGLRVPDGGRVLEVGCGTGRNLILAARRYPNARLYGFDISSAMLEKAQSSVRKAGLEERITLALGDAASFSSEELFQVPGFDRVFVSYALSMIPPWYEALDQAYAAVLPGGSLHVVDFGEQSELPEAFRTALRAWLARFSVEPREGLETGLRLLAERAGGKLTLKRTFRDYARTAVLVKIGGVSSLPLDQDAA